MLSGRFSFLWDKTKLSASAFISKRERKTSKYRTAEPCNHCSLIACLPPTVFSPLELWWPFRRHHLHSRVLPPPLVAQYSFTFCGGNSGWCTIFRMNSSHCRTKSPPTSVQYEVIFLVFYQLFSQSPGLARSPRCLSDSIHEASQSVHIKFSIKH